MYCYQFAKMASCFSIMTNLDEYRYLPHYMYGFSEFLAFLGKFELLFEPIRSKKQENGYLFTIGSDFAFQLHIRDGKMDVEIIGHKNQKNTIEEMVDFFKPSTYSIKEKTDTYSASFKVPISF